MNTPLLDPLSAHAGDLAALERLDSMLIDRIAAWIF